MDQDSPLQSLFVDEEELNEELLADIVKQYARITSESGNLVTKPAYKDLDAKGKILVAILAHKARYVLEHVEDEWITPTAIAEMTGIKKGTVYPAIRDLANRGLVQDEDGQYRVLSANLEDAKAYLEEN